MYLRCSNYIPDMYNKAVGGNPQMLEFITDHFKTQEICEKAVEGSKPCMLEFVLDQYKEFVLDQYETKIFLAKL